MKKKTFANRLSIRIMAVLIVISTIIMVVVYLITKESMDREAEARYESRRAMKASSFIPTRRYAACSPTCMWAQLIM